MLRMKIVSAKELFATPGAARCRDGTVVKVMTMVVNDDRDDNHHHCEDDNDNDHYGLKIIMAIVKMMIIQARDGFSHYLDHLF